jgi:hypothetical protein
MIRFGWFDIEQMLITIHYWSLGTKLPHSVVHLGGEVQLRYSGANLLYDLVEHA